jgi:hypothetical protein
MVVGLFLYKIWVPDHDYVRPKRVVSRRYSALLLLMVFVLHIYVDEYGYVLEPGTFLKECCLLPLEFTLPLPFLITELKTSSFCGAGLY